MFIRSPQGVYRSTLLSEFVWLVHGFGSRHSDGWPGAYTHAKQIHSDAVIAVSELTGCVGTGDALVTATAGKTVGIRTADCVPLLMADTRKHAVGAVHAGWRGTAAGIAARAVEAMQHEFGTHPSDLRVAIGPCIAECCFVVGHEVSEIFRAHFPERTDLSRLDLVEANRRQLISCGIPPEAIDSAGTCTVCSGGEFHSYRRDRERSGRMVAAIGVLG